MKPSRPHTLLRSLQESRGNSRICILTEPMWGVPYNLFAPFASVYMLALGLAERTIGAVAAFGLALQVLFSLLAGPATDKLGRKRATLIFDLISWSIPAILWALARNALWFYLAALFNAVQRFPMVSWTCLLIEDAPRDRVVHYWAWVYIAGIVAGIVTPLAGLLIARFELIPTMRVLYLFALVSMTAKFFILNHGSTETKQGAIRMAETSRLPFARMVLQSLGVFKAVFSAKGTVAVVVLMATSSIYGTIRNTFFGVLLTEGLGFAPGEIGWFAALKSIVMLAFFFLILPRLHPERYLRYLVGGLTASAVATVILVLAPGRNYPIVLASVLIESLGAALIAPHLEGFVYAAVEPSDRARILAVANTVVLAIASPFGWIGGALAEIGQILPFVLVTVLLAGAAVFLVAVRPAARGVG